MTLKNPRNRATIRTSINYRVPLWDRCVPGKPEPAFAGLADLQNPPHKWHGFRIFAHNPKADHLPPVYTKIEVDKDVTECDVYRFNF
jgi:hypothetical protein